MTTTPDAAGQQHTIGEGPTAGRGEGRPLFEAQKMWKSGLPEEQWTEIEKVPQMDRRKIIRIVLFGR